MADRRYPFYHLVPKDLAKNLTWRKDVLKQAQNDPELQEELRIMCSRDILFWINTFCWIEEPRNIDFDMNIPFITWEMQDENIEKIEDNLGRRDMVGRKSRETSGTWTFMTVFTHKVIYLPGAKFLVVSRKEDLVDTRGDATTLIPKVDFILDNLPAYMRPPIERNNLFLKNTANGAFIKGESTTGEIARSGRYLAVLLDEHGFFKLLDGYRANAATLGATNCRIFLSTFNGFGNAYDEKTDDPNVFQIVFPWWEDPRKNPGLYRYLGGKIRIYDTHYQFPKDYKFRTDGVLRSPWRDAEGDREKDPAIIAGEVDMNKSASKQRFFPQPLIDEYKEKFAREPDFIGELEYDPNTLEPIGFFPKADGRIRLWQPRPGSLLSESGLIVPDPNVSYGMGADIGTGTGLSDSIASFGELDTHWKVGELVDNRTDEIEFGKMCVALCRWLNNAFAIWDAGGPGKNFGKQFTDNGYGNIYFKQDETRLSPRPSDIPGFYFSGREGGGRRLALGFLRAAMTRAIVGRENWENDSILPFYNPSAKAIEECKFFHWGQDGEIVHAKAAKNSGSSGEGQNHADRTMGDSLLNFAMKQRGLREPEEKKEEVIDAFSYQGRERLWEIEQELEAKPGFKRFFARRPT